MAAVIEAAQPPRAEPRAHASSARPLAQWWPLVALTLLAAVLRFATLDLQSFWYDEAFTPVHVLHASLAATLHGVVKTENTPPLWYVLIWAWSRLFGTGVLALRFPSALAGVATVPVAWSIARELAGRGPGSRRAAIVCAALAAVNPLFVWYSQEARAYGLYVFLSALALLCMLRADREATPGRLAAFAISAALALATFYFEAFMLIPMALWLLRDRSRRRLTVPAVAVPLAAGIALVPLVIAQGGHGTQWISSWALASRVQAIAQYYLTGYSGAPLGHGIELLIGLLILVGLAFGCVHRMPAATARGAGLALVIAACGVLLPLAMAIGGADYLAPRNVVAAMIPLTALLAVVIGSPRTGLGGMVIAALVSLAFLAITLDVNVNVRLQRSDWNGVAAAIRTPLAPGRAITIEELASAPLEYYMPPLHNMAAGSSGRFREIDEIGWSPLRSNASDPPAPGFRLARRLDIHDLIVYRFLSPTPVRVSEQVLIAHVLTVDQHSEVLVPGAGVVSVGAP
jgi:uncharacterized membrane protein